MPASLIMVTVDINSFLIRNMEGALTSTSLCTVVKHTSDFLSLLRTQKLSTCLAVQVQAICREEQAKVMGNDKDYKPLQKVFITRVAYRAYQKDLRVNT